MKINDNIKDILSYYGGFIDGEGHIGIKKYTSKTHGPTYSERVSVGGINKSSIESFNDLAPGYLYFHKHSKLSSRGFWSWEVTDKRAKNFLRMIRPYLKVKGLDADLVLALSKNKEKNNRRSLPKEDLDLRENLYFLTKKIHHEYK